MKIYIEKDERYPDYYASEENYGFSGVTEVEITEAEWKDYLFVRSEYTRWQDRLEELVRALKQPPR